MKCYWCNSIKNKELYILRNDYTKICPKCFKSLPDTIKQLTVCLDYPLDIDWDYEWDKYHKNLGL